MHIILLKSCKENQEDPYAKTLQENGFDVSLVETLDFIFHHDQLKTICPNPSNWADTFSAVIFTSPRAVQAFKLSGLPVNSNTTCFVVGNATKLVAESIGFKTTGSDAGNADILLDLIVNFDRTVLNKPLLFPCGKMHRPVLPVKLEENGLQVKSVIVYSTKESMDMSDKLVKVCNISSKKPDLLIYFSPSGVTFSEKTVKEKILPNFKDVKFGSMGAATSAQLVTSGFSVSLESRSPMPEAMLKAVKGMIAVGS